MRRLHSVLQGDGNRDAGEAGGRLMSALHGEARLRDPSEPASRMCRFQLSVAGGRSARRPLEAEQGKISADDLEDGIELRCDPGFPDARRKEPYYSEISEWAVAGERDDMTVVVISGRRLILVTGSREFDLGIVGPDERIVRELDDGRVVNARGEGLGAGRLAPRCMTNRAQTARGRSKNPRMACRIIPGRFVLGMRDRVRLGLHREINRAGKEPQQ